MARIDSLTAVTVCVNYSDYLAEVVDRNRVHFDEWIIVTCPSDESTARLCREKGLTCIVSDVTGPAGEAFDSAYSKHRLVNEGLCALHDRSWVLIIDADVLLPFRFRERLHAQDLYPRAVYGMTGRRMCVTWLQYSWRQRVEPWVENLEYHPNILGYFQLFSMTQPHKAYPIDRITPIVHDDIAFQYLFKAALRRRLPFNCIHVGPPQHNWAGRDSAEFRTTSQNGAQAQNAPAALPEAIAECGATCRRLMVIGFDCSTPFHLYAEHFAEVGFFDFHGVLAASGNSGEDRDRAWQRPLLEAAARGCPGLQLIRNEGLSSLLSQLRQFMPDAVHINFEIDSRQLILLCRMLIDAGLRGVQICGLFFGYNFWQSTTIAVSMCLGRPDCVHTDGSWNSSIENHIEHADQLRRVLGSAVISREEDTAWVTILRSPENMTGLLHFLCSARRRWNGRIVVIAACGDCPQLDVLRSICQFEVLHLPPSPGYDGRTLGFEELPWIGMICARKIVYIDLSTGALPASGESEFPSGTVLAAPREAYSRSPRKMDPALASLEGIWSGRAAALLSAVPCDYSHFVLCDPGLVGSWYDYSKLAAKAGARRPLAAGLAAACMATHATGSQPAFAVFGAPEQIDHEEVHNQLIATLRPTIRVKAGTSVITVVTNKNLEVFASVFPSWNFPGSDTITAILCGTDSGGIQEKVPLPLRDRIKFARYKTSGNEECPATEISLVLRYLAGFRGTSLIYIPAICFPLPGAHLFEQKHFLDCDASLEVTLKTVRRAGRNLWRGSAVQGTPVLLNHRAIKSLRRYGSKKRLLGDALVNTQDSTLRIRYEEQFSCGWGAIL